MSSRMINLALRAVPPPVRARDGAAIVSMAEDLANSGRSSAAREARGIAGYGVKKRAALNLDNLRSMPWGAALWRLALPIATVQLAMLIASSWISASPAGAAVWPGSWWACTLLVGVTGVVAAALRSRLALGVAAFGLLALFAFDTWGPGGSMLGDVSHTRDFSLGFGSSLYSPVALVIIPTTLLLLLAATANAPDRLRSGWATSAWIALPCVALLGAQFGVTQLSTALTGQALVLAVDAGFAALALSSLIDGRRADLLAAALLLCAQSLLLGVALADAIGIWLSSHGAGAVVVWGLAICGLFTPVAVAGFLARRAYPPYRGS